MPCLFFFCHRMHMEAACVDASLEFNRSILFSGNVPTPRSHDGTFVFLPFGSFLTFSLSLFDLLSVGYSVALERWQSLI